MVEADRIAASPAMLGFLLPPDRADDGERSHSRADPLGIAGAVITHFRILDLLGAGGMGVVYRAEDIRLRRVVALKFLTPTAQNDNVATLRFLREAQSIAVLEHPNVCTLYEVGQSEHGLFLAMQYYTGETLRARLTRSGRLPARTALDILAQAARGLECAHAHGIVHRDIKPANVMITEDGVVRVLDFGVAKVQDVTLTASGVRVGTLKYMAPEQHAAGFADARSDLWSLGAVFVEMLTGSPPRLGRSTADTLKDSVPATEELSADIHRVADRLLRPDPAERYASARELLDDIPGVNAERGASPPRLSRARLMYGAVGIATVALGAAIWSRYFRDAGAPLNPTLLAVAPFSVYSPDLALWREGLVDVFSRNFDGAGALRTVSPSVLLKTWVGRADAASADAASRRLGAGLAMLGTLQRSGSDSARLGIVVRDVTKGATISEIDRSDGVGHLDRLVDSATIAVLRDLSRLRPVVGTRLSAIGTHSLPALKEYLQGMQFYRRWDVDSARQRFERAIELDTAFALALRASAETNAWIGGDSRLLAPRIDRAASNNHGLGRRDSMLILVGSMEYGSGYDFKPWSRQQHVLQLTRQLVDENPSDPEALYLYADVRYHGGSAATGVKEGDWLDNFDRAIAADSSYLPAWTHTIPLSARLRGHEIGLTYLRAYLRRLPPGDIADGVRMTLALYDAGGKSTRELEAIWDAAPPGARAHPQATASRMDPDLVFLRLYDHIVATQRREGTYDEHASRTGQAAGLTYRGLFRQATQIDEVRETEAWPVLISFGAVPAETAAAAMRQWESSSNGEDSYRNCAFLLGWYASRGDSSSIRRCDALIVKRAARGAAVFRREELPGIAAYVAFYSHLASRDTAAALRAVEAAPDSVCPRFCIAATIDRASALAAVGRLDEARRMNQAALRDFEWSPLYIPLSLQRARLATRLGDHVTAVNAYRIVRDAWTPGDSSLQPIVLEAKRAVGNTSGSVRSPLE
ncbi:MAG TPA: serine/threonine-protein kinase [Gemmatimonadaceae bacterium]|nr:serine/threonine-protein kinase [Gemmatimonadaceae bacterium]